MPSKIYFIFSFNSILFFLILLFSHRRVQWRLGLAGEAAEEAVEGGRVRDVTLFLLGSSHATDNGFGGGGEEGREAECSGSGWRQGGDGPRPMLLDAVAADPGS